MIGAPTELIEAVQQTLGQDSIQREEWRDDGAAYQFKLYNIFGFILILQSFLFVGTAIHG